MCACVCLCACVCVFACVCACVCVFVCVNVYIYLCLYVFAHLYVHMHLCLFSLQIDVDGGNKTGHAYHIADVEPILARIDNSYIVAKFVYGLMH